MGYSTTLYTVRAWLHAVEDVQPTTFDAIEPDLEASIEMDPEQLDEYFTVSEDDILQFFNHEHGAGLGLGASATNRSYITQLPSIQARANETFDHLYRIMYGKLLRLLRTQPRLPDGTFPKPFVTYHIVPLRMPGNPQ